VKDGRFCEAYSARFGANRQPIDGFLAGVANILTLGLRF
jgi:hypothetical protein